MSIRERERKRAVSHKRSGKMGYLDLSKHDLRHPKGEEGQEVKIIIHLFVVVNLPSLPPYSHILLFQSIHTQPRSPLNLWNPACFKVIAGVPDGFRGHLWMSLLSIQTNTSLGVYDAILGPVLSVLLVTFSRRSGEGWGGHRVSFHQCRSFFVQDATAGFCWLA